MKVKAIGLRGRIQFHFSEIDNERSRMARIEIDILRVVGFINSRLLELEEGKIAVMSRDIGSPFTADNIAAIQKVIAGYCLDIEWEQSAQKALNNLG